MGRSNGKTAAFLLPCLIAFSPLLAQNWEQKQDLPNNGRKAARVFTLKGKAYLIGGVSSTGPTKEVYRYDPKKDQWSIVADFPGEPRRSPVAFSLNGKGYYGTGRSYNGLHKDLWRYDPASDSWTQVSSLPASAPPREMATAWTVNGKAYIGIGRENSYHFYNDVYEYDPSSNTWAQVNDYPGSRPGSAVAFSIDSFAYVGTGGVSGVTGADAFYRFDPSNGSWSSIPDLPGPGRRNATAFTIGKKGYVGLGWNGDQLYRDLYRYDPSKKSWKAMPDLPDKERRNASGFSLKGKGYAAYGYHQSTGNESKELWAFIPKDQKEVAQKKDQNDSAKSLDLKAYPVPVNSGASLRLEIQGNDNAPSKLDLLTSNGNKTQPSLTVPAEKDRYRLRIPSSLENGVYYVCLRMPDGRKESRKILIQD